MKQFRIEQIVLDQLSESVQTLVEKNYFSDEDYAISYLVDVVRLFQLNIDHLVVRDAPASFKRYCVITDKVNMFLIVRIGTLRGMRFLKNMMIRLALCI